MNHKSFWILVAVCVGCVLMLSSCNKNIKQAPDLYPQWIISLGGGYTGYYDTYKIYPDGLVEKYNEDKKQYLFYAHIPLEEWNSIQDNIRALNFDDITLDNPGNFTYLLERQTQEKTHSVRWNVETSNYPIELHKYFIKLEQRLREMPRYDK